MEITIKINERFKRLAEIAETTPEEFIQTYIADLTDSEGNGGSNEREAAKKYFLLSNPACSSFEIYEKLKEYIDNHFYDDREKCTDCQIPIEPDAIQYCPETESPLCPNCAANEK